MANFTALDSGARLTGTEEADLFVLSASTGVQVIGRGGADTVEGTSLTGDIDQTFISLNGGPDFILATGDISASTIRLGAGGDTLIVSGEGGTIDGIDSSQIFAGAGSDLIQSFDAIESSLIEMGDGADTLLVDDDIDSTIVRMGAGRDSVIVDDDVTDTSTVQLGGGADFIRISADLESGSEIDGGAGNDTVDIRGDIQSGSTVRLGGGADSLVVSSIVSASSVNGGAGGDTIRVSGALNASAVIFGDGGNDLIELLDPEPNSFRSSRIDGGEGNDTIRQLKQGGSIGDQNFFGGLGADLIEFAASSDVDVKYRNANESNINTFDTIGLLQNQGFGVTGTAWIAVSSYIAQPVTVATGNFGDFNVTDSGLVSFTTAVSTLTGRVEVLNKNLVQPGSSVVFDAEGFQYFFMSDNDASSTEDDLLVQFKQNSIVAGIEAQGTNSRVRAEFFIA